MSAGKSVSSIIGKIGLLAAILAAFTVGLFGTIRMALYNPAVQVPNVVGQDRLAGESTLEQKGLNLRVRMTRYVPDKAPNTILDQSPHPDETVKKGQTVAVVLARAPKDDEAPAELPADDNNNENGNSNVDASNNTDNKAGNSNKKRADNKNNNGNKNNNSNKNANKSDNKNSGNKNANSNKNANGNSNKSDNKNTNSNSKGDNKNANKGNSNKGNGNNANSGNRNRRTTPEP